MQWLAVPEASADPHGPLVSPRSTILHESKLLLKSQAVADQAVAEALCSIMLLEESSPRQALTDFLMARKSALQKLLHQQQHGGSGGSWVQGVEGLMSVCAVSRITPFAGINKRGLLLRRCWH